MDFNDLNKIKINIAEDEIDIKENDFLYELYDLDNFDTLFDELDILINQIEYHQVEFTLIWYVGFFNIIKYEDIENLPNISKLKSYNHLKGGLIKYFRGHFHLTNYTMKIKPYRNYYSFIEHYVLRPFQYMAITKLLNWIYIYDKKFFFELHYFDKSNFHFLRLFKLHEIKNFELEEKYIDFNCEDELKNYILFYYIITKYIHSVDKNLPKDIKTKIESDFKLIEKIEVNILIKIILDYVRFDETKKIPCYFFETIEENEETFFTIFESLEIYNINELNSLGNPLKEIHINQDRLFQQMIIKLEKLLTEEIITIDNYEWEHFLNVFPEKYVLIINNLLQKTIGDLTFISELDREIRSKRYFSEKNKEKKLKELIDIAKNIN